MNWPTLLIFNDNDVWNAKDSNDNFIEAARLKSSAVGGDHQKRKGNKVMICVTDTDGWEEVLSRPSTVITSYEEIFGYQKQIVLSVQNKIDTDGNGIPNQFTSGFHNELQFDENGDPVMETIPPVPAMRAQYDAVWPNNNPGKDEPLMGIPAGYDMSHLTI